MTATHPPTLEEMGVAGLAALRALIAAGEFHHATYRDVGTCWEGLWLYRRDPNGHRGFSPASSIPGNTHTDLNRTELDEAYRMINGGALSVGSYGEG